MGTAPFFYDVFGVKKLTEEKQKRNTSPTKIHIPEQKPEERIKNFNEVALGYTPEMAMEEARRPR